MRYEWNGTIGIDIGSFLTKVIKIGRNIRDSQWVIAPIPDGIIINNRIASEDLLAKHIRGILKENRIKGRRCSLCLPSHHIIKKVLFLPAMEKQALIENLYYDIEEYLPLGLDNYIIDYKVIKTSYIDNIEYYNILAVAVLEEAISSYIRILKKAGLKLQNIDIPSNCLEKFLIKLIHPKKRLVFQDGNHCFIDIGAHSTNIFIFSKGNYFVDKTIDFGSAGITSVIPNQSYLQQLLDEIMGIIRYFKNQVLEDNSLNNIILFGGGAMLENLSTFLERQIGIGVTLFSDWINFDFPPLKRMDQEEIVLLCNAAGSTIRGRS